MLEMRGARSIIDDKSHLNDLVSLVLMNPSSASQALSGIWLRERGTIPFTSILFKIKLINYFILFLWPQPRHMEVPG